MFLPWRGHFQKKISHWWPLPYCVVAPKRICNFRLSAITQDAELEDHRTHEIEELAKEIIRLSDEAEKTHAAEKQQNDDNTNNAEEKKKVVSFR